MPLFAKRSNDPGYGRGGYPDGLDERGGRVYARLIQAEYSLDPFVDFQCEMAAHAVFSDLRVSNGLSSADRLVKEGKAFAMDSDIASTRRKRVQPVVTEQASYCRKPSFPGKLGLCCT